MSGNYIQHMVTNSDSKCCKLNEYLGKTPLSRPPLSLRTNGLYSEVVLILS